MITDEDVIKRRLLIDGDGTGDDRRLVLLLKTFVKWCNSSSESAADMKAIQDQLLGQLSQSEYVFEKCKIATEMNEEEIKNYDKLADEIKKEIEKSKVDIQRAKDELQKARVFRKNHIEYEVVANVIDKHPERMETMKKLEIMKKELSRLDELKQELEDKIETRRKHFHVLVASLHQLQAILDTEENDLDNAHVNISDEEMDTSETAETIQVVQEVL